MRREFVLLPFRIGFGDKGAATESSHEIGAGSVYLITKPKKLVTVHSDKIKDYNN